MKLASPSVGRVPGAKKSLARKPGSDSASRLASRRGGACVRCAQFGEKNCTASKAGEPGETKFYLNSLVAQVWFLQLREHIQARYAQGPGLQQNAVQTGYGWRSFCHVFGPLKPIELVRLFENLLRLANYEGYLPARTFFLAYAPLAFEHDTSGEYIGPGVWTPGAGAAQATRRVRRTLRRWCEWLEALAHFQVHELSHKSSVHLELDKLVIFLWPLFKHHGWTPDDLLDLVCSLTNSGTKEPYTSAAQFADYCRSALGLHWAKPKGRPQAVAAADLGVAQRLFNFLPAIH